ncbi:caspase family protein [Streptomyces sp. MUM 2J]|uniref:caspase, EACC1-associated type n=1 Tax=Streptomyces sp. MUM 2J TaxID=2791987 RepID=UPI001F04A79C|nr:caspase family protein [Streptomyces sp. MUM 2J]MCH0564425.1 caspase family protein [Streptomyces sp. MUM 2J]
MGRRLALLIATYEYQDSALRQLTAPAHDTEALGAVLRDPAIAGFEVTTLVNQPLHLVGQAIGDFYRDRRRDDLTLLYFTGHGLKDDSGRLYLAMTNTRHDSLLFTALSAEQIDQALEGCVSRQKVLILDCCYSGAYSAGGRISKGDTAVHALERFQGRGRTVLTASDSTQYSFEGGRAHGQAPQSVFTRYLVEGLRDGSADLDGDGDITLDELYGYVHDRVVEEIPQQRPKKQDNVEGRIVIARNINWQLPLHLHNAIGSPMVSDRLGALDGLAHLHRIGNEVVRAAVMEVMRGLQEDDSKQVSAAAAARLQALLPQQPPPEPAPTPAAAPAPAPLARATPAPTPRPAPAPTAETAPPRSRAATRTPAAVGPPAPPAPVVRATTRASRPVRRPRRAKTLTVAVALALALTVTLVLVLAKGNGEGSQSSSGTVDTQVIATATGAGTEVEFSPDGKLIAVGSDEGIRLLRASDAQTVTTLAGRNYPVFSPDGSILAMGDILHSGDGANLTVRLLNLATGKTLVIHTKHSGSVLKAFSPKGDLLATAMGVAGPDYDNPVRLWNTTTGKLVASLSGHRNGVQTMAFTSDGKTLATGAAGSPCTVRLWDMTTRKTRAVLPAGCVLAFSPHGKTLATSSEFAADQKVHLWDVDTAKDLAALSKGRPVGFSADRAFLAIQSGEGSAQLWKLYVDKVPRTFTGVSALRFSTVGEILAIVYADGTAELRNLATSGSTVPLTADAGSNGKIQSVAFSPDGRTAATANADGTVRVWRLGAF